MLPLFLKVDFLSGFPGIFPSLRSFLFSFLHPFQPRVKFFFFPDPPFFFFRLLFSPLFKFGKRRSPIFPSSTTSHISLVEVQLTVTKKSPPFLFPTSLLHFSAAANGPLSKDLHLSPSSPLLSMPLTPPASRKSFRNLRFLLFEILSRDGPSCSNPTFFPKLEFGRAFFSPFPPLSV